MKTFKVGVFMSEGGHILIEAGTEGEARERVEKIISEEGMSGLQDKFSYEISHRETEIVDIKED